MAVYSHYPIDPTGIRTFQQLPLEGHAGRATAGRSGDAGAGRLVLAAELDVFRLSSKSHWDLPIVIGKKVVHFLASHPTPAGLRRAGGSERNAELRRDPPLGRLHHPRARVGYIYDDAGRHGGLEARLPVRDRGRPELRPARRRQHPRRDPAAARASARQHAHDAREPGRRRAERAPGRHQPDAPDPIRASTRRTSRTTPRATSGPTTCCRGRTSDRRLGRLLAAHGRPALPARRRLPVPDAPTTGSSGST